MAEQREDRATGRAHGRARLRAASLVAAGALLDLTSRGVRCLPTRLRYLPADAVTLPLGTLWRRRMRIIEGNYAIVLGHPGQLTARTRTLARASLRNFGHMAMDFLAVRTMPPAQVLALNERGGEEDFADALRDGHGVIFALPHAGSWDVAAAYALAYGLRLTVVTESNWVTELVAGSRSDRGVTLAPRDQARSLRLLFQALARGECAVMLSDMANAGVQTLEAPFFGVPAPFPSGPARLSQRTGAPILVITTIKLPSGHYRFAASPPIRPDRRAPADDEVRRLTAAMAAGFERIIAAYPDQWYPFHDVWPSLRAARLARQQPLASASARPSGHTDG